MLSVFCGLLMLTIAQVWCVLLQFVHQYMELIGSDLVHSHFVKGQIRTGVHMDLDAAL
jgi:hypothetical protein